MLCTINIIFDNINNTYNIHNSNNNISKTIHSNIKLTTHESARKMNLNPRIKQGNNNLNSLNSKNI